MRLILHSATHTHSHAHSQCIRLKLSASVKCFESFGTVAYFPASSYDLHFKATSKKGEYKILTLFQLFVTSNEPTEAYDVFTLLFICLFSFNLSLLKMLLIRIKLRLWKLQILFYYWQLIIIINYFLHWLIH